MRAITFLLLATAVLPASAATPLPPAQAANWLQRMADAARRLEYTGVFVMKQGDRMQTVQVENYPSGAGRESRLVVLDGEQREVRCNRDESVSVEGDEHGARLQRRLGNRHFPDLLPANAGVLAHWYTVRLGANARVGGRLCREVEIVPKDAFRWGYVLCAQHGTYLPLRAVMVNESGRPLLQYSFADLKVRDSAQPGVTRAPAPPALPAAPDTLRPMEEGAVLVRQLPPGFSRVAAMRRSLPRRDGEVEHWVFSDGLTHVSLFVEPAMQPVASLRGQSPHGTMNLLTRQVGRFQVTVLGEAPWPTVEAIALNVRERLR